MQYAFQTRDYKNDYRWSWEDRGRKIPLAEISLALQRIIKDGEKGIAVMAQDGQFHVIFSAVDKLGTMSLGKDFSGANIRVNMVFSDISQEMAKGLVQYYLVNQSDPGVAFADIITWDTNSWKINELKVQEAFNRIPTGRMTGNQLFSFEKGGELRSWQDYDLSDTNGVKFVMQANQLKFAVESVPLPQAEIPFPQKVQPPKKKSGGCSLWIAGLFIVVLTVAVCWLLNENINNRSKIVYLQQTIDNTEADKQKELISIQTKLDKAQKELAKAQIELAKAQTELAKAQTELAKAQTELADKKTELDDKQKELEKAQKNVENLSQQLETVKNKVKKYEDVVKLIKNKGNGVVFTAEFPGENKDEDEKITLLKTDNTNTKAPDNNNVNP